MYKLQEILLCSILCFVFIHANVRVGLIVDSQGLFAPRDQDVYEGVYVWKDWTNSNGGVNLNGVPTQISLYTRDGYAANNPTTGRVADATVELLGIDNVDVLIGPFSALRHEAMRDAMLTTTRIVPMMATQAPIQDLYDTNPGFIFGVNVPSLQTTIDGMFPFLLQKNVTKYSYIYREGFPYYEEFLGALIPYLGDNDASIVYTQSYIANSHSQLKAAVKLATKKSKKYDAECVIILTVAEDLPAFAHRWEKKNYKPLAAITMLDIPTAEIYNNFEGLLVTNAYEKSLPFGNEDEYLGTNAQYQYTFEQIYAHPAEILNAVASAACVLWQKAAEGSGADWSDVAVLNQTMMGLGGPSDQIFIGDIEMNNLGQNIATEFYLYSVGDNDLEFIESVTELDIPTEWPWSDDDDD